MPNTAPNTVPDTADLAELLERERAARLVAERAAARMTRLQGLTASLATASTVSEIAEVVVGAGVATLEARAGSLGLLTEDGTHLQIVRAHGYAPEVVKRYRRIPLETDFPLTVVARTGEPLWLPSAAARDARMPHLAALRRQNGDGAMASVPVVLVEPTGHRVLGVLGLNWAQDRALDADDRGFVTSLASIAAQALERARLLEAERAARIAAEKARLEAEEANRAKTQFLATMSHELRTPLNAIQGHVQLMQMELHGPVTAAQREALARVGRAQHHLLALINDILNYARIESGRVEYALEAVALVDVVGDVVPMIEPLAAARSLALDVQLPDEGATRVIADREKLGQVLINLLSNAVKFTPAGGRITVEVATRSPHDDPPPAGTTFLRVRDTGPGIARDKLETIFEPFVQLHTGHTRTTEGTGLGLAISRDLARGMGGDLRVRSAPGEGAAFTVSLRRA